jgi:hypothetical protein
MYRQPCAAVLLDGQGPVETTPLAPLAHEHSVESVFPVPCALMTDFDGRLVNPQPRHFDPAVRNWFVVIETRL